MAYKYKADFAKSFIPAKYKEKGLMLYALALKYDVDDVDAIAASSLTDNSDDKCIDAIHFVSEEKTAVIVQGYMAKDETKPVAPSSKAADFNIAFSWALAQPIAKVPLTILTQVTDLRKAIAQDEISHIEYWYVHNLDESAVVQGELTAAVATAKAFLDKYFAGKQVSLTGREVGNKTIEDWYRSKTQMIMVDDTIEAHIPFGGYCIGSDDWAAFDTSTSLDWLQGLFKKYGNDLFSANIRGYLGSKSNDINMAIKETCVTEPKNFWVYNNGITCLVHGFEYDGAKKLTLFGISVVNGAQTSGAVGSANVTEKGYVPIRFVIPKKDNIWEKIITFNNSQNKIVSSDFRSNDEVQKRLREEIKNIKDTDYSGRRGGALDITRKQPNLLSTEEAGVSLFAFHNEPALTYHKKSQIWSEENYSTFFNNTLSANHLVFCYSLHVAIEDKKEELRNRFVKLTGIQLKEYEFLKKRGGMRLYLAAIGQSMEEILSQKIADTMVLSFGNASWKEGAEYWKEVVNLTIMNYETLSPGVDNGILKKPFVDSSISNFKKMVAFQVQTQTHAFDNFKDKVKFGAVRAPTTLLRFTPQTDLYS